MRMRDGFSDWFQESSLTRTPDLRIVLQQAFRISRPTRPRHMECILASQNYATLYSKAILFKLDWDAQYSTLQHPFNFEKSTEGIRKQVHLNVNTKTGKT